MKKKANIVPESRPVKLVVGAQDLSVFKGPNTSYQVVKHLQHCVPVQIWEEKEGWVKISEKDEEWVPKTHLQIVSY